MTEETIPNAADPVKVRTQKQKDKLGRDRELSDLCVVLSSREGRRFVWGALVRSGIFEAGFQGEATHATAFFLGARNEGLRLLADINEARPEAYLQMLNESKE